MTSATTITTAICALTLPFITALPASAAPVAQAPQTGAAPGTASDAGSTTSGDHLVGRGVADITGEVAEVGMMGYGSGSQKTSGLHMRQYARSYIIESGGERVLLLSLIHI